MIRKFIWVVPVTTFIFAISYYFFIPEFKRLSRWQKNIDVSKEYLKNQTRMTDSCAKYVGAERHIFRAFKDSHDYYFGQVMSHVWKDD